MRLIDIEELKGCVIIKPKCRMDFVFAAQCSERIEHEDIQTAFDLKNSINRLNEKAEYYEEKASEYDESGDINLMMVSEAKTEAYKDAIKIIKSIRMNGGVNNATD